MLVGKGGHAAHAASWFKREMYDQCLHLSFCGVGWLDAAVAFTDGVTFFSKEKSPRQL
jgi:hypothetical protein